MVCALLASGVIVALVQHVHPTGWPHQWTAWTIFASTVCGDLLFGYFAVRRHLPGVLAKFDRQVRPRTHRPLD